MVMSLKKLSILTFLLMSACSSGDKNTRYKDTTRLEKPPVIKVASKPKTQGSDSKKISEKGLGRVVSLDKNSLHIAKTFDRSWEIVGRALRFNNIKVKDKNRALGVFYVIYDPDNQASDDSTLLDQMTFFLFKDEYEEMDYKLALVAEESGTNITADAVEKDINDLLDDGGEPMEGMVDNGSMLLNALYKTIKNDL